MKSEEGALSRENVPAPAFIEISVEVAWLSCVSAIGISFWVWLSQFMPTPLTKNKPIIDNKHRTKTIPITPECLLLDIKDLKVWYKVYGGYLKVLDGVNFTVAQGDKVGLVGEAGLW